MGIRFTLKTDGPCHNHSHERDTLPRIGDHIRDGSHYFLVKAVAHESHRAAVVYGKVVPFDFDTQFVGVGSPG